MAAEHGCRARPQGMAAEPGCRARVQSTGAEHGCRAGRKLTQMRLLVELDRMQPYLRLNPETLNPAAAGDRSGHHQRR